ncbi:MAG: endonuclease domain-containing protein [Thermoleophilia bacterium]
MRRRRGPEPPRRRGVVGDARVGRTRRRGDRAARGWPLHRRRPAALVALADRARRLAARRHPRHLTRAHRAGPRRRHGARRLAADRPAGARRRPRQHQAADRRAHPRAAPPRRCGAALGRRRWPRADPQRARGPGAGLLDGAGIDRPEINPLLHLDGRAIRPDLLFADRRLVVELDGRRWHDDPLTQQDDAARQAILEAHGHRVLRITWLQVVSHPQQTLRRIRAALAAGG